MIWSVDKTADSITSTSSRLHRPCLRIDTKNIIAKIYVVLPDGSYQHKITGKTSAEPYFGHKYGWENRRSALGSLEHLAAHALLGAIDAGASGNNALTAAIAAGGSEAIAPLYAQAVYGTDDLSKLSAEQRNSVAAIGGIIGSAVGASTGNVNDLAMGNTAGSRAVENNWLTHEEHERRDTNRRYLNYNCSPRYGNPNSSRCLQARQIVDRLDEIDKIRDNKLYESYAACVSADEEGCRAFVYAHVIQRRQLTEQTYDEFRKDQAMLSEKEFNAKWQVVKEDDYHQWDKNLVQNKAIDMFNKVANECVVQGSNACAEAYREYSTGPTPRAIFFSDPRPNHRGIFPPNQ